MVPVRSGRLSLCRTQSLNRRARRWRSGSPDSQEREIDGGARGALGVFEKIYLLFQRVHVEV